MAFEEYRRPGGILLWFLQRLTALFLLAMLLSHFYFLHYYQEGFVTYDKVAARLASPSWKAFDMVFLGMAMFHGMNGLWTLVLEYVEHNMLKRLFLVILVAAGLLFLGIGVFSIATFTVKT